MKYVLLGAILQFDKEIDQNIRGKSLRLVSEIRSSYNDYDRADDSLKRYIKAAKIANREERISYIESEFKESPLNLRINPMLRICSDIFKGMN